MTLASPRTCLAGIARVRCWGRIGLLGVVFFVRVYAQSSLLTEEECEATGQRIAHLLNTASSKAVIDMFDFAANFELITNSLNLNARNKELMRERHRSSSLHALNSSFNQFDSARFLRVLWIEGEKRVLLRLQNKGIGEYNYLSCTLARDDLDGGIKITDLHDFLAGETYSQATRDLIQGILDVQTQAIKDRTPEIVQAHLDILDRIETASGLVDSRRFKEALDSLKDLPETWKRHRLVLTLRFLASEHVNHDECQRVAQDWAEAFPGDASLDMILELNDEWLNQYDQAIQHVDSLMKHVGKDGYLSFRKASLCLKNNDPAGAKRSAQEALEQEPDLDEARLIIVKSALREKDHRITLFAWRDFHLRFPETDLARLTEAEPGYDDFIQSAEYQQWAARQNAP